VPTLELDPKTTAAIFIDLQHGIVSRPIQPYPASEILSRSSQLAAALRTAGGTAVYVRVDIADIAHPSIDAAPMSDPNGPPAPPIASQLVPENGHQPGDVFITKRQWGAFYATDLDQQLRRRNIKTLLMAGIATNIGVESTARAAHDMGYHLVFVEDAMGTFSPEWHAFATTQTFPRMGRVRKTEEVLAALGK
jgi:nicotinamidase-related amidase